MFNVNPVEIHYTRIAKSGVLAGIPCPCVVGVESEEAGQKMFDQLVTNKPTMSFSDLSFHRKK
jgi:hypothetical protein